MAKDGGRTGTAPRTAAEGVSRGRARRMPVVLVDSKRHATWPPALLACLADEARTREWRLVDMRYFEGRPPAGVTGDGALVQCLPDDPLVAELRRSGCAVVRLGRLPHPDDASLPAVLPDLRAEGRQAAEHFVERGFRHIGYVGHEPWSDAQMLFEGFHAAAVAAGVGCHLLRFRYLAPARRDKRRRRLLTQWVAKLPKPVGLLCFNDQVAAQFCAWLTEAGFRVPVDVALLGHGNTVAVCESGFPHVSSIDTDERSRARVACDLLARLMAGAEAPLTPVLTRPSGVVTRESTDVLATPNLHVAAALRYLWAHLARSLSVDDVAREVGVSRRTLEREFRRELGRGVNAELRRKRLDELCRLLRTTRLPVVDLAPRVGFPRIEYLHRCFRAAYGVSPRKYRLRELGRGMG